MSDSSSAAGKMTKKITLNGINGASGDYFTQPFTVQTLLDNVILQQPAQKAPKKGKTYRLAPEFGDPADIKNAGWGLIFPADADAKLVSQIEEALDPLIKLRKSQTAFFKILKGGDGYRRQGDQGETFIEFLRRHYAGIGGVDPTKIPYYLLIVSDPNSIPYEFQFSLNGQYAVGRIYFERLEEYSNYARSVVAAETGQVALARKAVFFGASHPGDEATNQSASNLIAPLTEYTNQVSKAQNLGWQASLVPPEQATKSRLNDLLGGNPAETPALLFTATHGLEWPYGDPRQQPFQGALVCQDYPGPADWKGELKRDFYMAGEDIAASQPRSLLGMVAVHFACFGGGTPYWDDFAIAYEQSRKALARQAFMARLPLSLLSHPGGGALAVISHVERAWTYSFQWDDGGAQPQALRSLLYQIMQGKPVGLAFENLDERYATIAGDLLPKIETLKYEPDRYDPFDIAANWIMAKDARGYALLGDPAARLALAAADSPSTRPAIEAAPASAARLPDILVPASLPESERAARAGQQTGGQQTGGQPAAGQGSPASPAEPVSGGSFNTGAPEPENTMSIDPAAQPGAVPAPPAQPAPPMQSPAQSPGPSQAGAPASGSFTVFGALVEMNQNYGAQGPQSFGIKEDVEGALKNVVTALTGTFTSLSANLQKFAADVTSLDVETFVVNDLADPNLKKNPDSLPQMGKRVAWTHVNLDGDIQVAVPMEDGKVNETLWQVHKDMVDLAQTNRTEMIKAVTEALTRLVTPLK